MLIEGTGNGGLRAIIHPSTLHTLIKVQGMYCKKIMVYSNNHGTSKAAVKL